VPGEPTTRWRVADGEEARLTPGASTAAEVWSRGFLPLRVRLEDQFRLRPAFPGTAVVLGESHYEVVAETQRPEDGLVVYNLRPWPEGEVIRDRAVYGPALVLAAQAERERAHVRERARRWRFLLYPLVGLLPEEEQVRACERLGLYAVTATLVSGLVESVGVIAVLLLVARSVGQAGAIMVLTSLPGLILFVLPGLGRAFGAVFLNEVGGSAPVAFVLEAARALGASGERHDRSFVPLTRAAFWERLARGDSVKAAADGTLVVRGLLPHLTWEPGHRIAVGRDYWQAVAEPPALEGGRLVYTYRLSPVGDPPGDGEPPPSPPPPSAYVEEVLDGVRREWDDWNEGFAWYTSLLPADLQARAFDHRGGPAAVRRATLATAAASTVLALYLALQLPGGPAADPVAPFLAALAATLLVDAARRTHAARQGRYAPSLLRFLLPSDALRPERAAYHAHRDAERQAFDAIGQT
jgi:hypothetical protein